MLLLVAAVPGQFSARLAVRAEGLPQLRVDEVGLAQFPVQPARGR
jgi:hypothetical protein